MEFFGGGILGWFIYMGLKEIAKAINPRYEEEYDLSE